MLLSGVFFLCLQFILEPFQSVSQPRQKAESAKPKTPSTGAKRATAGPTTTQVPTASATSKSPPLPVLLPPLTETWLEVKYSFTRCLHIWHMELTDDSIVALVQKKVLLYPDYILFIYCTCAHTQPDYIHDVPVWLK